MFRLIFGLPFLLAALPAVGAELVGIVTEVHDGDTITLVNWQHTYEIRLIDIDAPELDQPHGKDSRTNLREMCLLKKATVDTSGEDRYGRTLGRVRCVDTDANSEQVNRGWAWVFVRYAPKNSPLFAVEHSARMAKRGLWADDAPIAPWEWRAKQRIGGQK
jgi:endonuclease YncB( thermonuclease family)